MSQGTPLPPLSVPIPPPPIHAPPEAAAPLMGDQATMVNNVQMACDEDFSFLVQPKGSGACPSEAYATWHGPKV